MRDVRSWARSSSVCVVSGSSQNQVGAPTFGTRWRTRSFRSRSTTRSAARGAERCTGPSPRRCLRPVRSGWRQCTTRGRANEVTRRPFGCSAVRFARPRIGVSIKRRSRSSVRCSTSSPKATTVGFEVLDAMAWQADWVLSHLAEGDTTVAVRAMEQVRGPADEAGDPRAQAAVRFYLASFLSFGLCQLDQAAEECRAAIELFERAGESESALLATNELAWIQGCAGNLAADADLALEVCGKADTAGYRRVKILAAGTAGYALGMLGRFDEAEVLFGQSIELAEVEGSTYRLAWSRAQLGAIRSMRGPLDDAIASVEASLDADLAAPDALALENMAQCTWLNGRLESALSWLDQSAVRRPVNGSRRRAWGQALAARLHAEMGHPARAEELIGSAKSAYADSDLLTWSVWCWWNEGVLAWMIGDTERSSTALDRALRRLADMGAVALEALVLTDVAEIAADAGDVDRAAASAARSATVSEVCGGMLAPALARLALGWSDLAGGRPEAVIEPAGAGRRSPRHRPATDFTRPSRAAWSPARRSNMTGRQPSSVFVTRPSRSRRAARSGGEIEHCAALLISAAGAGSRPRRGPRPGIADRPRARGRARWRGAATPRRRSASGSSSAGERSNLTCKRSTRSWE